MQTFKKLLFLLSPDERKNAGFLLIMIIMMALLDVIGVASILPFMAVLTNPSIIETNLILNTMFQFSKIFGIENSQQFIFTLGILVFLLLVFSLTFKALTTYIQMRFVLMREYSIGRRLIKGYLHQPYSWFLSRHSADLGKTILSEVGEVIGLGLGQMMDLIAKGVVAMALITLLIIVDPKLAFIVGSSLAGIYLFIFYFIREYLRRIGNKRLENNQLRFTAVSEAFGAAKEVKVGGLEQTYIKSFSDSAKIFAQSQASSQVVSQLPRYILEAIAFGGILLITLYIMALKGSFNSALPVISLYVFAGYRLMPALQQIYSSFTRLAFVGPSLDKLTSDIKNLKPFNEKQDKGVLSLNKAITLKNIHYEYPNASRTALKNINLSILAKSTVGIIGATGSGKTTTVDIILGLLEPQKGTLEVDGKVITQHNSRSWQRSIGYVPQHIYLSDDTIAANIAFGVEPHDIDLVAVEKAAKIANLHNFLIDELPEQYQTTIGERGVRLSGGQRQRIGIARALYYNPNILILDEATSALDSQTEKAVMDAVNNLRKDITIIIIAHRLATIKKCDKIFLLEKGHIKNEGTFEELKNINENFRMTVNN
ncbi:ABC transporter ATP-binding protein/permease [Candidatus Pelagibacter sp.]|jgi:ATP-binding cassette, subfamily B, bacterial PglK|nr:ABC transporter ATP-binding protein/permease [Candidatus Pelagibacter sp.]